jgi:hypothetical protein
VLQGRELRLDAIDLEEAKASAPCALQSEAT